jgi:hypothetical protein
MSARKRPPKETQNEWIRFIEGKPVSEDVIGWLDVKAAEIGWDFYDLAMALMIGVKKAEFILGDKDKKGGPNLRQ